MSQLANELRSTPRCGTLSPAALVRGAVKLHRDEDGMISMVSVVVLLFILVLIGMVGNVGYAVSRKMEVQNSADAVAYTSAVWQARGMNVITATNHLIGEMQSLVVIHIAIGGEELANEQPLDQAEADRAKADLDSAQAELDVAWAPVHLVSSTPAYPDVNQKVGEQVKSGATIRASMTDLKRALAKVYYAKAAAKLLELTPAAEIGEAIELAATAIEYFILLEYEALKLMETFAEKTLAFRHILSDQLLPNASDFERMTVEVIPRCSAQAAKAIAQRNATTGCLYPLEPALPVLPDHAESKKMDDADIPRSALVRATYPWVKYDRTPILQLTSWMIFSHCRDHYINYTDRYTFLKSRELYNNTGRDFTMYVMTKPGESKGSEPWTDDSRLANHMFTLVGFAHRPSRTLFSPSVFGVPNRDGVVACAQAIIYNVNSQNPGNGPPTFQPEVGWDTLNWDPPVTQSGAYEYKEGPEEVSACPRIKINWQAKLVPVTRLGEATQSGELSNPVQTVLERLGANPDSLLTH